MNQSDLHRHLKEIASADITDSHDTNSGFSSEINCLLFDGMTLVRSLKKDNWVKTCQDLGQLFIMKVQTYLMGKHCKLMWLIFDPYTSSSLSK